MKKMSTRMLWWYPINKGIRTVVILVAPIVAVFVLPGMMYNPNIYIGCLSILVMRGLAWLGYKLVFERAQSNFSTIRAATTRELSLFFMGSWLFGVIIGIARICILNNIENSVEFMARLSIFAFLALFTGRHFALMERDYSGDRKAFLPTE